MVWGVFVYWVEFVLKGEVMRECWGMRSGVVWWLWVKSCGVGVVLWDGRSDWSEWWMVCLLFILFMFFLCFMFSLFYFYCVVGMFERYEWRNGVSDRGWVEGGMGGLLWKRVLSVVRKGVSEWWVFGVGKGCDWEWWVGIWEVDEGRDMIVIYLRYFIIIREVNKEMRLWK